MPDLAPRPSLVPEPVHSSPTLSLDGPGHTIREEGVVGPTFALPAARLADGYGVEGTLGTGGMSVVRLARQRALDRPVAVKSPIGASPEMAARLLQEAWVTGALEHPGVVPVHDVAVDEEGRPHIVMRRVAGWTWTQLLADPPIVAAQFGVRDTLGWHLRVLMSVAATVHHAHANGVLHRDLKPDNVMVTPTGEAYVLDWGLALALDERTADRLPRADGPNALAGTPSYLAPEMARKQPLGVHTDVYLLGGLLHTVLTGEPPHRGEDVVAVLAGIPSFVPAYGPDVPRRLADLARAALSLDPGPRPTAEGFRRAIQRWLEERDTDALLATAEEHQDRFRALSAEAGQEEPAIAAYAAARASLEQVRARDPAQPAALEGLARLGASFARWELGRGRLASAELVMEELGVVDPALAAALATARAVERARAARAAAALSDRDPGVGVRTRAFVMTILGVFFTILPAVGAWVEFRPGYGELGLASAASLAVVVLLWTWARDSLSKSALNRAVISAVAAALAMQLAVLGAGMVAELPPAEILGLFPLLWACFAVAVGVTLDPVILLVAPGFVAAFLVTRVAPERVWTGFSASNAWLLLVCAARWGPAAVRSWREMRAEKARAGRP